jgi:mRNA-degrading endonuclease YafQ of YafQ-DinJ toxin-antitoxin module
MPIQLTNRFVRQYGQLTAATQRKVDKALRLLDADFRYPGLRSHPVESAQGVFEAYVDVKYRMTFERHNDTLIMRNVDNHDECLRNP